MDAAHPENPRTAFGAIVAALPSAAHAGQGAFTGLSCETTWHGNGDILRQTVRVPLPRMSDPSLADWIDATQLSPTPWSICIAPVGPVQPRSRRRANLA